MRGLCRQFLNALTQAVNSVAPDTMIFLSGEGWKIRLQNEEQHKRMIDALTRFSCETLDLRSEPLPGLFDDAEDDESAGGV